MSVAKEPLNNELLSLKRCTNDSITRYALTGPGVILINRTSYTPAYKGSFVIVLSFKTLWSACQSLLAALSTSKEEKVIRLAIVASLV